MSKNEFLSELRYKLRRLPHDEVDNAISYYEEYFNDAGAQDEQRVVNDLISPSAVASKIIGEYAVADADIKRRKSKNASSLGIVLLAVFASPIALPLIFTVVLSVFSLFILYFSLAVSGIAIVLAGFVAVVSGFWAITQSFSTCIFFVGAGLTMVSLGTAMILGIVKISKSTYWGLQKMLGKLLIRSVVK